LLPDRDAPGPSTAFDRRVIVDPQWTVIQHVCKKFMRALGDRD
jgi:hypothetical protein